MTSGPVEGWVLSADRLAQIVALARAGVQFRERNGRRTSPDVLAELGRMQAHVQGSLSSAAVHGSSTGSVTAMPAGFTHDDIDTDIAATLLGVGPNRVRQLARAGQLGGRLVGRRWFVSRTACIDRPGR